VAFAPGSAMRVTCWADGVRSSPLMVTRTTWPSAVAGTVTTWAVATPVQAFAATRSSGAAQPTRWSSFLSTCSWATSRVPSTVATLTCGSASWFRASRSSPLSRFSGVKRQSSSRPVSGGKSLTSKEVLRPAREESGTPAPPPCEWACAASPPIGARLVAARFSGERSSPSSVKPAMRGAPLARSASVFVRFCAMLSPRILPSAIRSGGSARGRTPSAARGRWAPRSHAR
jgi:hypothetical protein